MAGYLEMEQWEYSCDKQQEAHEERKEKSKKEWLAEQLAWECERYEKTQKKELLIQLVKEGKTVVKDNKFMNLIYK